MSEVWTKWEGQVVNGLFPLRRLLGGTDHSGVFLTEYAAPDPVNAAIKLVPADPALIEATLWRWRMARTLSHPHLVRVFDSGRCQLGRREFLFVVMEYADQNLGQILPQRALSEDEMGELMPPTLAALSFLHRENLVQGQIRPSNILVVNDQLKLATDTVHAAGEFPEGITTTSVYDPPEARTGKISTAADVWALAVTMIESLTQRPPSGPPERLARAVAWPPGLSPELIDVIQRCLSVDPEQRPTIEQLQDPSKLVAGDGSVPEGTQRTQARGPADSDAVSRATGAAVAGTAAPSAPAPASSTGRAAADVGAWEPGDDPHADDTVILPAAAVRAAMANAEARNREEMARRDAGAPPAAGARGAGSGSTGAQGRAAASAAVGTQARSSATTPTNAQARSGASEPTGARARAGASAATGAQARSGTSASTATSASTGPGASAAPSAASAAASKSRAATTAQVRESVPATRETAAVAESAEQRTVARATTPRARGASSAGAVGASDSSRASYSGGGRDPGSDSSDVATVSPSPASARAAQSSIPDEPPQQPQPQGSAREALDRLALDGLARTPSVDSPDSPMYASHRDAAREGWDALTAPPPPPKERSVGLIVVGVLVAAGLAWGGYRFFFAQPDTSSEQTASNTTEQPAQPQSENATPGSGSQSAAAPTTSAMSPAPPAATAPPTRSAPAPAPAPAPAATPPPVRATPPQRTATAQSHNATSVIHEEIPNVPRSARDTIHGHIKVSVRVTVDSSGKVVGQTFDIPGPSKYFARLASEAARKWKFAAADNQQSREWLLRFEFSRDGTTGQAVPPRS